MIRFATSPIESGLGNKSVCSVEIMLIYSILSHKLWPITEMNYEKVILVIFRFLKGKNFDWRVTSVMAEYTVKATLVTKLITIYPSSCNLTLLVNGKYQLSCRLLTLWSRVCSLMESFTSQYSSFVKKYKLKSRTYLAQLTREKI